MVLHTKHAKLETAKKCLKQMKMNKLGWLNLAVTAILWWECDL